ncbi:MAG: IS30 family transposase, partial [Candidatus Brocadiaceae bacterium]|nr:IS30 family transposase [Candidatus Brocadiaceae bacterium]
MSNYIQLTQEERYHISVLCKEGYSKAKTAKVINRHISTISRELNRNTGKKGYRPKQAHEKALKRRCTSKKVIKFTDEVCQIVDEKISKQFSPDQISGKLRMLDIYISHERIYQHHLDDKRNGGQLYKNLRHSHRKRKKRYVSREKRGRIPKGVNDPIYFMDGTHPQHNCVAACGWIKKGKVKELKSNTGRHRLNVNSAINIETLSTVVDYGDSLNA